MGQFKSTTSGGLLYTQITLNTDINPHKEIFTDVSIMNINRLFNPDANTAVIHQIDDNKTLNFNSVTMLDIKNNYFKRLISEIFTKIVYLSIFMHNLIFYNISYNFCADTAVGILVLTLHVNLHCLLLHVINTMTESFKQQLYKHFDFQSNVSL